MNLFLFIHGALHGGWCWDNVSSFISAAGHDVKTPDLPGHGTDGTSLSEVSLEAYVDSVVRSLDASLSPVMLIGHSMSGAVITQAAEYRPDKVQALIYISAVLPENNRSIAHYSDKNTEKRIAPHVVLAEDNRSFKIKEDALKDIFYHDCPAEDIERARRLLVPQSIMPYFTPVKTTDENFGQIRRIYVSCRHDRVISPEKQKEMYSALPCESVFFIETGHSPFFAATEELAGILLSI